MRGRAGAGGTTGLVPPQYLKTWMLVVRCIHTRGEAQEEALAELKARGLWLNEEQTAQAELPNETDHLPT